MSAESAERWRRLQEMLDGALELAPEDQSAFLDEACGTDVALRDEARSLLDACRSAEHFLEDSPRELTRAAFDNPAAPSGTRIGPYRVVEVAGRGGMGIVYLAVRDDGQFDQRVALKLVPRGLDPETAARRVRDERRILASLNHPEIARLIDGGVTADGQPWFAMEFVEGTPIDVHCDRQRLGIEARLALFVRVADAVQYAHQNLVVHRDLKPSNILVGADGAIKLLDFGVAKILSPDSDSNGETTAGASRWFTPHYASPEQACDAPITTASDIYTLGVLLYELLTGVRPHRIASMTPAGISQAICEGTVERPSLAVLGTPDSRSTRAEVRGVRPERLGRRLRGDLDTIILKAMHKEPTRRYASAGALADDVRRHLAGHPVHARPDSVLYRTSKLVRRHRVGMAAALALLLTLLAGIGGTMWQARVAAVERDNAQQKAATAGQVSSLLVDMFRISDADSVRGSTVTAREVLTRGTQRIETEFANQPMLQATMLGELGAVYANLGLHDDAERIVRRAASVWRGTGRTEELAQALDQMGRINLARAHFDSAEAQLREAISLYERLHKAPNAQTANAVGHLGDALSGQRDYPAADSMFHRALAMQRQLHNAPHPDVAHILFDLAANLHDRGKFADAEPFFREALAIYRTVPGTPSPNAAAALGILGAVHLFREEYDKAEPLLREALVLRRSIYKNDHPSLIDGLAGLGTLLHNTSRFSEAERVLEEAVAMALRVSGAAHPQTLQVKLILASTFHDQGRYAEALRLQEEVLGASQARSGADQPFTVYVRQLRGETELARGKIEAARANFVRVVAEGIRLFGATHPYIALGMRGHARSELEAARPDSAEAWVRRALRMVEKSVRPNHRYLLGIKRTLAEALGAQARYAEADSIFRDVLRIERSHLPKGHVDLARTLHSYGALHLAMGNATAAEPLLREALAIRRERLDADHWELGETQSVLGTCLTSLGRLQAGEALLSQGYRVLRQVRGDDDHRVRRALTHLRAVQRRRVLAARD